MSMSMSFSKILIGSDTKGVIEMEPVAFYEITDHSVKYVVMYRLRFISSSTGSKIESIESLIPYYVSDGATNKLRANMLYPFMCYSSISHADSCPYNIDRKGDQSHFPVLLKYNILDNLNIDALESELFATFSTLFPDLPLEIAALGEKIRIPLNKNDRGHDLISVLQRITNLADFLICISSDSIRHFNAGTERQAIENGKYCPLSPVQTDDGSDYTNLSIFGKQGLYMTKTATGLDNASSPFNKHFRMSILATLNKWYQLFVHNGIMMVIPSEFVPQRITVTDFNEIANVCNKHVTKVNLKNYKIISNAITEVVTDFDLGEPTRSQLESILVRTARTEEEINEDELYKQVLKRESAVCMSKDAGIGKKNVFEMSPQEIENELGSYSEFIAKPSETVKTKVRTSDGEKLIIVSLQKYISDTIRNPRTNVNTLRDIILDVRIRKMRDNIEKQRSIRDGGSGSGSNNGVKKRRRNFVYKNKNKTRMASVMSRIKNNKNTKNTKKKNRTRVKTRK